MRIRRVALVSEHASPIASLGSSEAGGQNVYVAAVAGELARRGVHAVVYTRRDDPEMPRRVAFGVGAVVEHIDAGPPRPLARDALLPFMPQFGSELARAWSRWRPDVVHAHYWMSGLAAVEPAAELRIPIVQTFHALGATKQRHQGAADSSPPERARSEPMLASLVAAVVATSGDELAELRGAGGRPRIAAVVPCGVDTSRFMPVETASERPHRGRVVSVGRLVERKGVDDLIRSLTGLPGVHLIVAGGSDRPGDADVGRLRAIAAGLDVSDRVEFVGPIRHEEVPELLRSADVVACVPWYEPFGMVALEAMACGVPVVVSAVGGLRELVIDRETGLHVPPRDPERIAAAIRLLLDRSDLRTAFGRLGARRAARCYAWSHVTEQLLRIYARVVEEERS